MEGMWKILTTAALLNIVSAQEGIDCLGKPFYCIDSTHFLICVEMRYGVSTTVDVLAIPCPHPTECHNDNNFECELNEPWVSSNPMETMSIPISNSSSTSVPVTLEVNPDVIINTKMSETTINTEKEAMTAIKQVDLTPSTRTSAALDSYLSISTFTASATATESPNLKRTDIYETTTTSEHVLGNNVETLGVTVAVVSNLNNTYPNELSTSVVSDTNHPITPADNPANYQLPKNISTSELTQEGYNATLDVRRYTAKPIFLNESLKIPANNKSENINQSRMGEKTTLINLVTDNDLNTKIPSAMSTVSTKYLDPIHNSIYKIIGSTADQTNNMAPSGTESSIAITADDYSSSNILPTLKPPISKTKDVFLSTGSITYVHNMLLNETKNKTLHLLELKGKTDLINETLNSPHIGQNQINYTLASETATPVISIDNNGFIKNSESTQRTMTTISKENIDLRPTSVHNQGVTSSAVENGITVVNDLYFSSNSLPEVKPNKSETEQMRIPIRSTMNNIPDIIFNASGTPNKELNTLKQTTGSFASSSNINKVNNTNQPLININTEIPDSNIITVPSNTENKNGLNNSQNEPNNLISEKDSLVNSSGSEIKEMETSSTMIKTLYQTENIYVPPKHVPLNDFSQDTSTKLIPIPTMPEQYNILFTELFGNVVLEKPTTLIKNSVETSPSDNINTPSTIMYTEKFNSTSIYNATMLPEDVNNLKITIEKLSHKVETTPSSMLRATLSSTGYSSEMQKPVVFEADKNPLDNNTTGNPISNQKLYGTTIENNVSTSNSNKDVSTTDIVSSVMEINGPLPNTVSVSNVLNDIEPTIILSARETSNATTIMSNDVSSQILSTSEIENEAISYTTEKYRLVNSAVTESGKLWSAKDNKAKNSIKQEVEKTVESAVTQNQISKEIPAYQMVISDSKPVPTQITMNFTSAINEFEAKTEIEMSTLRPMSIQFMEPPLAKVNDVKKLNQNNAEKTVATSGSQKQLSSQIPVDQLVLNETVPGSTKIELVVTQPIKKLGDASDKYAYQLPINTPTLGSATTSLRKDNYAIKSSQYDVEKTVTKSVTQKQTSNDASQFINEYEHIPTNFTMVDASPTENLEAKSENYDLTNANQMATDIPTLRSVTEYVIPSSALDNDLKMLSQNDTNKTAFAPVTIQQISKEVPTNLFLINESEPAPTNIKTIITSPVNKFDAKTEKYELINANPLYMDASTLRTTVIEDMVSSFSNDNPVKKEKLYHVEKTVVSPVTQKQSSLPVKQLIVNETKPRPTEIKLIVTSPVNKLDDKTKKYGLFETNQSPDNTPILEYITQSSVKVKDVIKSIQYQPEKSVVTTLTQNEISTAFPPGKLGLKEPESASTKTTMIVTSPTERVDDTTETYDLITATKLVMNTSTLGFTVAESVVSSSTMNNDLERSNQNVVEKTLVPPETEKQTSKDVPAYQLVTNGFDPTPTNIIGILTSPVNKFDVITENYGSENAYQSNRHAQILNVTDSVAPSSITVKTMKMLLPYDVKSVETTVTPKHISDNISTSHSLINESKFSQTKIALSVNLPKNKIDSTTENYDLINDNNLDSDTLTFKSKVTESVVSSSGTIIHMENKNQYDVEKTVTSPLTQKKIPKEIPANQLVIKESERDPKRISMIITSTTERLDAKTENYDLVKANQLAMDASTLRSARTESVVTLSAMDNALERPNQYGLEKTVGSPVTQKLTSKDIPVYQLVAKGSDPIATNIVGIVTSPVNKFDSITYNYGSEDSYQLNMHSPTFSVTESVTPSSLKDNTIKMAIPYDVKSAVTTVTQKPISEKIPAGHLEINDSVSVQTKITLRVHSPENKFDSTTESYDLFNNNNLDSDTLTLKSSVTESVVSSSGKIIDLENKNQYDVEQTVTSPLTQKKIPREIPASQLVVSESEYNPKSISIIVTSTTEKIDMKTENYDLVNANQLATDASILRSAVTKSVVPASAMDNALERPNQYGMEKTVGSPVTRKLTSKDIPAYQLVINGSDYTPTKVKGIVTSPVNKLDAITENYGTENSYQFDMHAPTLSVTESAAPSSIKYNNVKKSNQYDTKKSTATTEKNTANHLPINESESASTKIILSVNLPQNKIVAKTEKHDLINEINSDFGTLTSKSTVTEPVVSSSEKNIDRENINQYAAEKIMTSPVTQKQTLKDMLVTNKSELAPTKINVIATSPLNTFDAKRGIYTLVNASQFSMDATTLRFKNTESIVLPSVMENDVKNQKLHNVEKTLVSPVTQKQSSLQFSVNQVNQNETDLGLTKIESIVTSPASKLDAITENYGSVDGNQLPIPKIEFITNSPAKDNDSMKSRQYVVEKTILTTVTQQKSSKEHKLVMKKSDSAPTTITTIVTSPIPDRLRTKTENYELVNAKKLSTNNSTLRTNTTESVVPSFANMKNSNQYGVAKTFVSSVTQKQTSNDIPAHHDIDEPIFINIVSESVSKSLKKGSKPNQSNVEKSAVITVTPKQIPEQIHADKLVINESERTLTKITWIPTSPVNKFDATTENFDSANQLVIDTLTLKPIVTKSVAPLSLNNVDVEKSNQYNGEETVIAPVIKKQISNEFTANPLVINEFEPAPTKISMIFTSRVNKFDVKNKISTTHFSLAQAVSPATDVNTKEYTNVSPLLDATSTAKPEMKLVKQDIMPSATENYVHLPNENFKTSGKIPSKQISLAIPTVHKVEENSTLSFHKVVKHDSKILTTLKSVMQSSDGDILASSVPYLTKHANVNSISDNNIKRDDSYMIVNLTTTTINTSNIKKDIRLNSSANLFPPFDCKGKLKGKYPNLDNIKKFYICIGRVKPIAAACPLDSNYDSIKMKCTSNNTTCLQFHCVKEGRFKDPCTSDSYYICHTSESGVLLRFKLKCSAGYHVNATTLKCYLNSNYYSKNNKKITNMPSKIQQVLNDKKIEGRKFVPNSPHKSGNKKQKIFNEQEGFTSDEKYSKESDEHRRKNIHGEKKRKFKHEKHIDKKESKESNSRGNSKESNEKEDHLDKDKKKDIKREISSEEENDFSCQEPGLYPFPRDCRKYYVCYFKNDKGKFRRRIKRCSNGEIFDRKRKMCTNRSKPEDTNSCR